MTPESKSLQLNWLDRAVDWLSPQAGLQRAKARAVSEILRGYEAARTGRRMENWLTSSGDANSAADGDLQRMRDRSRDVCRNNPHAAHMKSIVAGGAVGTGIIPQADTGRPEWNKAIDAAFAQFCDECDADGQLDFYGLQRLVADGVFESGETLVRRRLRRDGDGFHVPLQLQVMECDHIDLAQTKNTSGGVTIQGVEFDAIGRRAGYWLYPAHPGALVSSLRDSLQSRFVPATEIAHVYKKTRPGQVHGAPALATVLTLLRDMDEYMDAEIVRAKIAACLAMFVEQSEAVDTTNTIGPATTSDASGLRIETMRPGMILYGKPGEKAQAVVPAGHANFAEYMKFEQHVLALGVDMFYAQFGDLSAVNWSSFRAGDRDYRAAVEAFRWLFLVPMFLETVWEWFIDAAYLAGKIPAPHYGVRWSPPQFLSVDPRKDAEADEADLSNGAVTWPEVVARRGNDPQKQLDQIVEWQKKLDDAGVTFAWDRRKVEAQKAVVVAPPQE
jgi:lambda family phage portal protein